MTLKSPDAFRTISEVADELELPQHVLRFWETKFNAIRPMKRGGGRRYYRPADVDLLKGIRHLLYSEGYTIKGVQKILKDQGNRFVMELPEQLRKGAFQPLALQPMAGDDGFDEDDDAGDVMPSPVLRSAPPHNSGDGTSWAIADSQISRLKTVLRDLKQARAMLAKAQD